MATPDRTSPGHLLQLWNAAHPMECKQVGDGQRRSLDEAWEDREWCAAVARFPKSG